MGFMRHGMFIIAYHMFMGYIVMVRESSVLSRFRVRVNNAKYCFTIVMTCMLHTIFLVQISVLQWFLNILD